MKKYIYIALALISCFLTFQISGVEAETALEPIPIEIGTGNPGFQPDFLPVSDLPINEDDRVVIGDDDRLPVLIRAYPYTAIGRVDWVLADGRVISHCTGTLIDRDLVLTNSHCLVLPIDGDEKIIDLRTYRAIRDRVTMVFQPNMIDGIVETTANVVNYEYGWKENPEKAAEDWALLKLDRPLGDDFGYLGWKNLDLSDPETISAIDGKIRIAGYAGDFPTPQYQQFGQPGETAGLHQGCSILKGYNDGQLAGLLFHQCDTNLGSSGSAIFARFANGNYYILGLHAGSNELVEPIDLPGERTKFLNRGVQVNRWSEYAERMR